MRTKYKVISIILLAFIFGNFSLPLAAETIIVRPTKVQLSLNRTIDAKTASQGDTIDFTVISPVYQDGKIIIEAGAQAYGRIEQLEKNAGLGKPATIAISLSNVDAVDGSKIPIMANRTLKGDSKVTEAIIVTLVLCIFGLFIKGENVTMQAGYTVDADVMGGTQVTLP